MKSKSHNKLVFSFKDLYMALIYHNKFRADGRMVGRLDGRKVILMPCLATTDQLKLNSNQLSSSAGARFDKILEAFNSK